MRDNRFEKGQIAENTVGNIITLIIGISVAVMILIFVGALGGQTFVLVEDDIGGIGYHNVTSESFIPLNDSLVELSGRPIWEGTLHIFNSTDTINNMIGNFTVDYELGNVLLKNSTGYPNINGTNLLANYTYGNVEIRYSIYQGIVSSFEALEQTGDYLPIIVLAVIIALVLGLVVGFMTIGGKKGETGGAL